MFGGMEEMQKIQKAMTARILEAESGRGLIKIKANTARQILDVNIEPSIIDADDKEQFEYLMLEVINHVIHGASRHEKSNWIE